MSEPILIALIGLAGAVLGAATAQGISAWFNRRKNKADERKAKAEEAERFASAANESIDALSNLQKLYDAMVEREQVRERQFDAEVETRRKAFNRIYDDYSRLRDEKRLSDEQHLELIRSKDGAILVLQQELKDLKRDADQWKAEAAGLRALQEDVKVLQKTTGELQQKQDGNDDSKKQ